MLLTAVWLLSVGTAVGQTMRDVFAGMPAEMCGQVDRDGLLDLVDFKESGMQARVFNGFGEPVVLESLSERYARLRTSDVSYEEMRLLERKKGEIVCVVFNYLTPVRESVVRFYTTGWEEIDCSKLLKVPEKEAFLKEGTDERDADEVWQEAGLPTVAAALCEDDDCLRFTMDAWGENKSTEESLRGKLKEELKYVWTGSRFEAKK